ncbi:MAG: FhaA domain-containing protein [Dermatophilaceae bacterium]
MGLFDKVERGLERTVNRAFAKAFRSEVQPVEIAAAIRRAMDDRAAVLGHGRTMVPNIFTIELSSTDFGRLDEYSDALSEELVAAAQEHAESQRYTPGGPVEVAFAAGDDLETGVFRVRPATSKRSLSSGMPARPAPGAAPVHAPAPAAAAPPVVSPSPVRGPAPAASAAAAAAAGAAAAGAGFARQSAPAPPASPASEPPTKPQFANPTTLRPWLDIDGERYPLLGPITTIGRDPSADIVLDDPGISRRHSEIRVTSDGPHLVASIRDLTSTNGTFVNGERITTTRLTDGDRLTVGRTSVTFRAGKR